MELGKIMGKFAYPKWEIMKWSSKILGKTCLNLKNRIILGENAYKDQP